MGGRCRAGSGWSPAAGLGSSAMLPPVLPLRLNRGQLLLETSSRIRCQAGRGSRWPTGRWRPVDRPGIINSACSRSSGSELFGFRR